MPMLSPSISESVHTACTAAAQEAGAALSRALDCQLTLQVDTPERVTPEKFPGDFNGPGLVIVLYVEQQAALVVVPESTQLVPAWCAAPDATGQSKLSTLAQELGMLLLPEDCSAESFEWVRVPNLAAALRGAGVAEDAAMISMPATTDEGRRGAAHLIWPAATPKALALPAMETAPGAQSHSSSDDAVKHRDGGPSSAGTSGARPAPRPTSLRDLPIYSRSLLRVKVPVVVTLAKKRQPVSRIVELGPGCIIQFDKSCEEMLDLCLGDRMVANGEAVKVGDKFGLRITNMVLPEERFHPVKKAQ